MVMVLIICAAMLILYLSFRNPVTDYMQKDTGIIFHLVNIDGYIYKLQSTETGAIMNVTKEYLDRYFIKY